MRIGLIREGKIPADNRVSLTPAQCKWIQKNAPQIQIAVQSSTNRCFSDREYLSAGTDVTEDMSDCDILLGIKEVPVDQLIPGKTYLFFSHTKKKQLHNQPLLRAILDKKIRLVDYECLEHEDGQRIIGFGFFAGIVGAHNGMMAYGNRTGLFKLDRVYKQRSFRELIHNYFGLRLPNVKIAVTGSGRVAHGILEIMNLMGIHEVEPEDYLKRRFSYPVYLQLKGAELYKHKLTGKYSRMDFHEKPEEYTCKFLPYAEQTDILMNGVYWEKSVPRLFEKEDVKAENFIIQTIADITDDANGSVPINVGDQTIEDPIYGIDKTTLEKTTPYLKNSIDIMAVGNLPNELPRDASRYFGEQLIKHVLEDLVGNSSAIIDRATIATEGRLTEPFTYLQDYVAGG
ncbi:MAG: alanine dehydrogenase [Chitinophagaceae bacterium]|nr:alanine dehydrogenase [Chitinophagaceae bacterium]MBK7680275.1 alanine dehydrogenase [Chitinophagaceae bacterium]MBK8301707.1 alanine dehydrogenase [Chitinophagaceae bacterium]MBK9466265.1 alanine dehydrogenase [Chitinophagaceae bacterium]MBK9661226.1 alanine dehydrogenase [Chitinophagaceae bacterium]